ncbi:MAG TPA: dTMP kinase [Candidatus Nitrosotalea sp.]|nr:dTMP kinase [Candidatus Nitrosotalea sp.]
MFVAVEGIEGSGKSTLVEGLARRLREEGHQVVTTREPGGTPVGDAIREIFLNRSIAIEPLTESLLVNAARAQHVETLIRPMLALGRFVICDRYTDSTLAYQGYGRDLDLQMLRELCRTATSGLEPQLVLLLDAPVAAARARLRERSAAFDRIENEDEVFHERVRRGFLALAQNSPSHRVLDASLSPDALLERALSEVRRVSSAFAP